MQIVELSANRLLLSRRPWFVPLLCFGMASALCMKAVRPEPERTLGAWVVLATAIVSCVAMTWLSADRVSMRLDRSDGKFSWTRRFGLGFRDRTGQVPLVEVRRAVVTSHDSGDGPSWRVELDVAADRIPLLDAYSGTQAENVALAERINQWLAGRSTTTPLL